MEERGREHLRCPACALWRVCARPSYPVVRVGVGVPNEERWRRGGTCRSGHAQEELLRRALRTTCQEARGFPGRHTTRGARSCGYGGGALARCGAGPCRPSPPVQVGLCHCLCACVRVGGLALGPRGDPRKQNASSHPRAPRSFLSPQHHPVRKRPPSTARSMMVGQFSHGTGFKHIKKCN